MQALSSSILAAVPEPGGFISIPKLVFVIVWLFLWALFGQWVDRDTRYVKYMSRYVWNAIILGGGLAGFAAWLLPPWQGGLFFAGFGIWFAIAGGPAITYVLLRNRYVDSSAKVFTPQHIARKIGELGGKKTKKAAAVERVPVTGADGKRIVPPEDPTQTLPYETVQNLLFDALWRRATEVDLAAAGENLRLIYSIDGVRTERRDLIARPAVDGAIALLKRAAGLEVNERRKPQIGRIKAVNTSSEKGQKVEVEVRTSGTTAGERLNLRIVTQESLLRLPDLGMLDAQLEQFRKVVGKSDGLVILSGPRRSGVTTSLYAALREHDSFLQNLQSLERVPLMDLENITQNLYDPTKADVTYARQLQSILRREPDVVMVSDCPDNETAHRAAQAAISGKKIYMGMEAKDSLDALKRYVSLCADSDVASAALQCITSQRLVRKLCVACREPYRPDLNLLRKANIPADKIECFYRARTEPMLDKHGRPILCPNCQGSGYYGRTAVFEVLVVDNAMRELIRNGQPTAAIQQLARKNGMRFLQEVAIQLVIKGTTGMNEVIRGLRDEEAKATA